VLGTLDDKIAANERITDVAEQLAITSARKIRTTVPLADLVEISRDQVSPPSMGASEVALFSIPSFDSSRIPEYTSPAGIKSDKLLVTVPTVLVSKLNPAIPRAWLVEPVPEVPSVASTEFLVLNPTSGLNASSIWVACRQLQFWEELTGKTTGTSNSHQRVRPADLLATKVIDPRLFSASLREQVQRLCRKAALARVESHTLSEVRDTLLPLFLSGEIEPRNAERVLELRG
jgi:type I restriction enzyme S subunit